MSRGNAMPGLFDQISLFSNEHGTSRPLTYIRSNAVNKQAKNTSAFFLEKALDIGKYVAMVMPKFMLNTPEYSATRELLTTMKMESILDFGERGFGGVLIETIAVCVNPIAKPSSTSVISITENEYRSVPQKYICDNDFPLMIVRGTSIYSPPISREDKHSRTQ